MPSATLALLLVLAVPGRAAELKHRFYIGPEEIRTLDTRTLAELLVARIHRECDLVDAPVSGEKVLGDDAALIMMVPAEKFLAIKYDGFLNQHQTHTTGGQVRESDRFEAEQELAMLRLPFDAKGLELLPKYAVLDVKKEGLGTYRLPTQYGDVAVIFKKEVAARATWTYADSLDYSQKSGRFDAGGAANPVLARTSLYERKMDDRNRCGNYCEAQVWGKLTLDDVEYVMVSSPARIPSAFADAGVAVYGYTVEASTSAILDPSRTAQYVRGARRPTEKYKGLTTLFNSNHARPLDEATLIRKIESSISQPSSNGGFASRQRLLAELAVRPKTPAVAQELGRAFASDDVQARAFALYGLSELPWADFKPRLLEGLDAAPGPLLISAVAFAADHQDDADVAAKLDRLRRAPASVATEWVERLTRARLCSAR